MRTAALLMVVCQIFANGLRVAEELTFSGGDGFLLLPSVTVQFRLRR